MAVCLSAVAAERESRGDGGKEETREEERETKRREVAAFFRLLLQPTCLLSAAPAAPVYLSGMQFVNLWNPNSPSETHTHTHTPYSHTAVTLGAVCDLMK